MVKGHRSGATITPLPILHSDNIVHDFYRIHQTFLMNEAVQHCHVYPGTKRVYTERPYHGEFRVRASQLKMLRNAYEGWTVTWTWYK